MYYEAVILELTPSRQPTSALVQFDYYENEQETPFSDLLSEECKHELEQDTGSIPTTTTTTSAVDDNSTTYYNGVMNDVKGDDVTGTTTSETDDEDDDVNDDVSEEQSLRSLSNYFVHYVKKLYKRGLKIY